MADPIDLISLAEAKRAINLAVGDTTVDTELATVITAASGRLDDLCGAVVLRAVTAEQHDGGWWDEPRTEIVLRRAPASISSATTITTVTEYFMTTPTVLTAETNAAKPSAAYLWEPELATLRRRSTGYDMIFAPGQRNIEVTYQAGRYADTTSVHPKFKQAAAIAIAHIWTNIGAGGGGSNGFPGAEGAVAFGIPPWDIPKAAMLLLASERRMQGFA